MSLFVLKRKDNGLYMQTGYSEGTPDLQAACIYSPKGSKAWMLEADKETLDSLWGYGVELIRVHVLPV